LNRLAAVAHVVVVTVAVAAGVVHAERAPQTFAERLLADVRARIDAAIVARPPRLVPPQKLTLKWKLVKLGSLELGAPLLALAGADLDGDGKAELYAVTTREVIAFGFAGKTGAAARTLRELSRVAFSGELASIRPRDPVGAAAIDGSTLVASASTYERSMIVAWQDKRLVGSAGERGLVQCPGEVSQLAPGRNYFGDPQTATYATRCSGRLVDTEGYPLRARAVLSVANRLDVAVERCAATNLGCRPAARHEYAAVGTAFEIADVDRDGMPDVVFAGAGAPGDPDVLKVVTLGDDGKRPRLEKRFTAGGVAGIAVADLDGKGGGAVVAAVRVVGATRVDVWRIE
jgi:hypothetical protein